MTQSRERLHAVPWDHFLHRYTERQDELMLPIQAVEALIGVCDALRLVAAEAYAPYPTPGDLGDRVQTSHATPAERHIVNHRAASFVRNAAPRRLINLRDDLLATLMDDRGYKPTDPRFGHGQR